MKRVLIIAWVAILSLPFVFESASTVSAQRSKKTAQKKAPAKKSTTKAKSKAAASKSKSSSRSSAKNRSASKGRRSSKSSRSSKSRSSASTSRAIFKERPAVTPATESERELLVSVPMAPIRANARFDAPYVANARLGTILKSSEKNPQWFKVQYLVGGKLQAGWISSANAIELDASADKQALYADIAEKIFRADMDFSAASALHDFLSRVPVPQEISDRTASIEVKRIESLRVALGRIGRNERNISPYAEFIKEHQSEIAVSEGTGELLVSSNLFWNLAEKYRALSSGDIIAWAGARNTLPSNCGDKINCHLFNLRMTDAEYLNMFPNGQRSPEALGNISTRLGSVVSDIKEKTLFKISEDEASKAELKSLLTELTVIVSRTSGGSKASVLAQIKQVGEAYR